MPAKRCLVCKSAVNPRADTGLPTGIFDIPQIDDDIKNGARLDFNSTAAADYEGKTLTINGKVYTFTSTPDVSDPLDVDISDAINGADIDPAKVVKALASALNNTADEPNRFVASGMSLEILPSSSGGDITIDTTGLGTAIDGVIRNKDGEWGSIQNKNAVLGNTFKTNTTQDQQGFYCAGCTL